MTPVEITRGDSPLILGFPHTGTDVPPDIFTALNPRGQQLTDTDWHIEQLYDDLLPDVTSVRATFHRYVIDANRDPLGASLYPGQNTTGLVPLTDFDNLPIWNEMPDNFEIQRRIALFHRPYHAALEAEIARVKARHGYAILYDCHSIRSVVPFLFEGVLPDLSIGTDQGITCDPRIEKAAFTLSKASDYSSVLNGRFRGGWTTRHYGKPSQNVHAIQMEITQSAYLETEVPPFTYSKTKAAMLRPVLGTILNALAELKL